MPNEINDRFAEAAEINGIKRLLELGSQLSYKEFEHSDFVNARKIINEYLYSDLPSGIVKNEDFEFSTESMLYYKFWRFENDINKQGRQTYRPDVSLVSMYRKGLVIMNRPTPISLPRTYVQKKFEKRRENAIDEHSAFSEIVPFGILMSNALSELRLSSHEPFVLPHMNGLYLGLASITDRRRFDYKTSIGFYQGTEAEPHELLDETPEPYDIEIKTFINRSMFTDAQRLLHEQLSFLNDIKYRTSLELTVEDYVADGEMTSKDSKIVEDITDQLCDVMISSLWGDQAERAKENLEKRYPVPCHFMTEYFSKTCSATLIFPRENPPKVNDNNKRDMAP